MFKLSKQTYKPLTMTTKLKINCNNSKNCPSDTLTL